jgi:hypothetical protein
MTTYYKATRVDGTDFHTGKVLYAVGKCTRPLPYQGEPRICGPGLLHAADVPAMTLVGGSWPCRLFEASGEPFAGFDRDNPNKGGFRQLTVVREIDAYLALGPNGHHVATVIERTQSLTYAEADDCDAAWWSATWGAAAWAARGAACSAAGSAARGAACSAACSAAGSAARAAARGVAADAATALLVRDLISPEQFDILCGPWEKVFGKELTRI